MAIGKKSKAIRDGNPSKQSIQDIRAGLDELIQLLSECPDEWPQCSSLRPFAVTAKEEMTRKKPDLKVVRGILTQISAGAGGFDALVDAVAKVQEFINYILR
ncbi:MAG: hypothetical protein M3Z75_11100 [Actinomycetota bacterium]|nr:hypothetical protein [Actinomycetota bacterium]